MKSFIGRIAGLLSMCTLALALSPASAAETPSSLAGAKLVTADAVKKLAEQGVMIVDTRVANEYAEGHIKGAKSIPYKEKSAKAADFDASQDSFDLSKLPSDKSVPVILYCNAGECWKSYKASVVAIKAGYKNIHWMRGGFPEWKSKSYAIE
jgi:rhodanese-related sulfurtransferase